MCKNNDPIIGKLQFLEHFKEYPQRVLLFFQWSFLVRLNLK